MDFAFLLILNWLNDSSFFPDLSKRCVDRRGRSERWHQFAERENRPNPEGNDAHKAGKFHSDKPFRGDYTDLFLLKAICYMCGLKVLFWKQKLTSGGGLLVFFWKFSVRGLSCEKFQIFVHFYWHVFLNVLRGSCFTIMAYHHPCPSPPLPRGGPQYWKIIFGLIE